jgi:hypothetical protein
MHLEWFIGIYAFKAEIQFLYSNRITGLPLNTLRIFVIRSGLLSANGNEIFNHNHEAISLSF